MLIRGEKPTIYNFEMDGIEGEDGTTTTVMSDGSSILQGEDIETTVAIFIAWDEATMQTYLEVLEEEEAEKNLYANFMRMAKQSLRQ